MTDKKDKYDLNTLSRFVDSVLKNKESPAPEVKDMIAVAYALQDMFWGVDLHKKFNLHKRPKKMDLLCTIHNDHSIVMAVLNGEITREKALDILMDENDWKEKKAEEYYKTAKPVAQCQLRLFKQINRIFNENEFKVLQDELEITPETTQKEYAEKLSINKNLKPTEKINRFKDFCGASTYQEAQTLYHRLIKKSAP